MRKLLYGAVSLMSRYCERCGYEAFVVGGKMVCCNGPVPEVDAKTWKRMAVVSKRRRIPPEVRERVIEEQNGKCFYCMERFDADIYRHGKRWNKKINVDHWEPFSFSCDDSMPNLVAACSVCNGIKSDLIFKDRYECRDYIAQQRRTKGYSSDKPFIEVSDLRPVVPG